MHSRYSAIFLTILLTTGFGISLFLKPSSSQANLRIGWTGEYYNNMQLAGDPVVTTTDEVIDMNWFTAPPFESLNSDHFSVRWTTKGEFDSGVYRFRAGADDGVRLLIDDKVIIDAFQPGTFRTITRDVKLEDGEHTIQVEYFEATGLAGVLVDWQIAEDPSDILDLDAKPQTDEAPQLPTANIASNTATIYTAPHQNSQRITQLSLYQHVFVLGMSEDKTWYQVKLSNSTIGWIQARFVHLTPDTSLPIIKHPDIDRREINGVALTPLRLRHTLDNALTQELIPEGANFKIVSRDDSGIWYQIEWDNPQDNTDAVQTGWVFAPAVKLVQDTHTSLQVR